MGRVAVPVRRAPQLPIESAATRVLLLAWSYLDARFALRGGGRAAPRGGFRVPLPERNWELWPRGSYPKFEDALEWLAQVDRVGHGWFWRQFVNVDGPFAPVPWSCPELDAITGKIGLSVFVPMGVSLSAGYRPGEAKRWARSWDAAEVAREVFGTSE